ncbi:MAG TPA: rod shape-determining protein MreD [Terriglobales bacterium]|nr:rod shape-determining protein MreD [Terriglobales bacterium]
MKGALIYTSREEIEVHRFSVWTTVGVPLAALFLQAFLPVRLHFVSIFDLPLLVTIYFGMTRRSPVSGLVTGGLIGLVQDSLTHQPLGVYGIAKTLIGFFASSLGVKLDVDSPLTRLLLTAAFYIVHQGIYFLVARGLVRQTLDWPWLYALGAALANGVLAVVLFAILDRFKQRT